MNAPARILARAWIPALAIAALFATSSLRAAPAPGSVASPDLRRRRDATSADLDSLHAYIRGAWATLTRSPADLVRAALDPKLPTKSGRPLVYVSRRENFPAVARALASLLPADEFARLDLRQMPRDHRTDLEPGLLYLPHAYVVPGGRFNEMYGWDSYFIVLGLLRDGRVDLARGMVDNAVYEAANFGKVLNANRTYYLERSQPPFLTPMIRAVFAVTRDRAWLASTLPGIRAQYRYWTTAPHMAGTTGLARYHALGTGPAPEVQASERDAAGLSHYDRVRAALRADPRDLLDVARYYDRGQDRLTPLAYVADRSVRESGFDPSDRFGRFSLGILDYAPSCLNSLLYAMERDTADILSELGNVFEKHTWADRAARRQRRINQLLWNPEAGLFADYDFVHGRRRWYPFACTFFPLWVGAATPEQARRVASVALHLLMRPGGLMTSTNQSGNQWDAPFGWAPLQLIAVEGLRRYGLDREADQLSIAFLGGVLRDFVEHGTLFEKYDVERRQSDLASPLQGGYATNEVGFGWTNGVFLELEAGLVPERRAEIVRAANLAGAPP